MKNETLINLIDYLLKDYGGDCCAKCVHCQQADENGNIPNCKPIEQDGNVACRNGMIAWFKQSTKTEKAEYKPFGKILREKRKARGWSQTQLGNKIGSYYQTICDWERGYCLPSLISLECLADVFECTLDELVGR